MPADEHLGLDQEVVPDVPVTGTDQDLDREVQGTDNRRMSVRKFSHRLATEADVHAIKDLMKASIAENMKEILTGEEISATQESMGPGHYADLRPYLFRRRDRPGREGPHRRLRRLEQTPHALRRRPHGRPR
jgi:hypothetical protein